MGLPGFLASPHIFISYRRSDAGGYAGQLMAALVDHYGEKAVTLDHASIGAGEDFAVALDRALNTTDVLLAVIGPEWVTVAEAGVPRLHQDGDWVRREIATALGRDDVRVIPVLVGGAELPRAEDLPEDLAPVCALQTLEVRPDRFDDDTSHLIDSIGGWRSRWRGVPIYAWLAAAALVVATAIGAVILASGDDNAPPTVAVPGRIDVVAGEDVTVDILSWASDDSPGPLALTVDLRSEQGAAIDDLGDGNVVYAAPRGFSGADSFEFSITDGGGKATDGTVFVDVRPGALDGAFNIVVPGFDATAPEAAELARVISNRTFEQTENAMSGLTDLGVASAGPEAVGSIDGDDAEARAAAVAGLADQLNANLVLYGTVDSNDGVSSVTVEMYISERGMTGATELAGRYALGTVERLTASPAAWELALTEFLDPRVRAIGEMFIGLAHYQLDDYAEAERRFESAEATWPVDGSATNGKETVLHLLGNVAGLQDRPEDAAARYAAALELDPAYARAEFGLAEVRFQEFRGARCGGEGTEDLDELAAALADFERIAGEPAPPLSFLAERAEVEQARIALCMSLYGEDRLDGAKATLDRVVTEGSGNPRLRNVIGEAHSSLATYHQLRNEPEKAIDEYRLAIETSLDDNRRAFYHSAIGDLLACVLGEPELARVEYAMSDALLDEPRPRAVCETD